mmetsp:Transcript_10283/g.16846  ORF Transcript_10283/g.16846 Transcript_10283/m.16846 type:complete len:160 (+) Transcript_10283:291-770(+)|eukprot:CAMPEP_0174992514 /NCGR_PEP_ID=MMETSP0004_2-20121128/22544_1 /TAXON_ID=420556 /ORGANISM="Ochromonas sp., Strain CCMP1393" /LENGTH=159 /DNA_ID=CAMNT_0016246491 /DNA_START=223 /DNA_END=702 /DNA_ORIENTATION=+
MEEKDYTLIFCRRVNESTGAKEILLGMKKRGFGMGKWNGFGGKLELDETIEECAVRELQEESFIDAQEMIRRGYLVFKMLESNKIMRVHVFETWKFSDANLAESEEMRPQWYNENELPFKDMWPDDQYWVPFLLSGKNFVGRFVYEDDETITEHDIREQ